MDKREIIFNTIEDLVGDFVFYGRKEDEELSMKELNHSINSGEISVKEIVSKFESILRKTYPNSI